MGSFKCIDCSHRYEADSHSVKLFEFENEFFNYAIFNCPRQELEQCRLVRVFLVDIPTIYVEAIELRAERIWQNEAPEDIIESFVELYGVRPSTEATTSDAALMSQWKDDLAQLTNVSELIAGW